METWQWMVALTGMLLIYAVLVQVFDYGTSPLDVIVAVVFGGIGLYIGHVISQRLTSGRE